MRALDRAVRSIDKKAMVVPMPFKSWTDNQISIRRGEVSMIAGPPGAGKSTAALAIAIKAKVPTLYASADSHESTMAIRSLAMATGLPQVEVEERMANDPQWATDILKQDVGHIRWMFDASPTLADLEDEINVYREVMGDNPQLVVVDNAVDVTHESGDEFSSLRSLMREVKWWSRDTGAAFLILHHTSEGFEGHPCPPRAALHGKIAQVPSLIVTLSSDQTGLMAAAPVKNRYGKADATGRTAVWMDYFPENMVLKDMDS
jgi:predicted ATP-dependent serine protease